MDTHFRLVLENFFNFFIALHLFGIESRFDTLFQINFLKLFLSLHYLQVRLAFVHPKRTDFRKISLKKYFSLHLFELGEPFCTPLFQKKFQNKKTTYLGHISVPQISGLMNLILEMKRTAQATPNCYVSGWIWAVLLVLDIAFL